ncbi:uncharacterized protein DNG_08988 [Cephalotrichum gorgonifer]|uniref:Heterokaryon incompatibility domain-containing protein n=1 Tax=Cephalotrichum gorgonifer TaxID=2041049 RepID=A0AAE8SYV8_9PEZI|nr:uncharacterized protein DNG_08988 [Cephalotrichum gorgonifer]
MASMSAPVPPRACKGCEHPRESQDAATFAISTVEALKSNGDEGCPTCRLILQGLEKTLGEETVSESGKVRLEFNGTGVRGFEVALDGDNDKRVSFFVSPGGYETHPATKSWPVGYEVPGSTSSPESLDWAKAHIDECVSSHSDCTPNLSAVLPYRVLDVGDSPNDGIRLKETDGESGRYLCLSHCWGTHAFLCTLKSNIASHMDSIPHGRLPATFRDAVHFTRLLGVRYLWIDSLCIIQDDEEDWRAQAGKMAGIYANGYITIAAVHAEGARGGLFSTLKPEFQVHSLSPSPIHKNTGKEPGIHARRTLSHISTRFLGSLSAFSPSGKEPPLLQRAWFFQERYLSERVLYFTSGELAWQCSARTACQCRGTQDDASLNDGSATIKSKIVNPKQYYHTSALTIALETKGKEEVARRWLNLVGDYSMLDMTFERDIFPALSGLAKVFRNLMGVGYQAGLWDGFIVPGLLWSPVTGSKKKWGCRPREWRAPTWSWASSLTVVSFPTAKELLNMCEVVRADCKLRGPDSTGEIGRGKLVLRGRVFRAKLQYRAPTEEVHPWNLYALDFMNEGLIGNVYADYDFTLDGPGNVANDTSVHCLLVGMGAEEGTCYLLILTEVISTQGSPQVKFERIGLVEVFRQKTRRVSPIDGTIRVLSGYDVIRERSTEETIAVI